MLTIEKMTMPGAKRGANTSLITADNASEMLVWARGISEELGRRTGGAWAGGTYDDALAVMAGKKSPDGLGLMDKLLSKIDHEFRDREALSWEPNVSGAYPVVPEALQGVPECMRMRTPIESDVAPIRIFVSLYISAGYSADDVIKRGAACAALAVRLAESRPTELWAFDDFGCYGDVTKGGQMRFRINTQPVNAHEVATLLCSASVIRALWYPAQSAFITGHQNSMDGLPPPWGQDRAEWMRCDRIALGASEHDIIVPAMWGTASDFSDPVAWVHKQLREQRALHND